MIASLLPGHCLKPCGAAVEGSHSLTVIAASQQTNAVARASASITKNYGSHAQSRLTLAEPPPTLNAMTFPTAFWAWRRRERGGSVA